MNPVPCDWVLYTTHIASEYVYAQFCAIIAGMPNVLPPLELDFPMLAACSHIASKLADAYHNPVAINFDMARYADLLHAMEKDALIFLDRPAVVCDKYGIIVLWYLPGAIDPLIQSDMMSTAEKMSSQLAKSVTQGPETNDKWRTHESNFHPSEHSIMPGCINLSPAWFLQAHPALKFHPEVLATLKGDVALRVMHPTLYWSSLGTALALGLWAADNQLDEMGECLRDWASVFTALAVICNRRSPLHRDPISRSQWFDGMTSVGTYGMGRMKMPNIGIEIVYDSGVMLAVSGRIVRHGMDEVNGD
ncbi:uncharacterized protein F5147DRAFT_775701 [Suillus discolor]|uniref:Uncharacterized protein n=1 Tax=Suillus discolor TaxID=1912936 RepID=A0A9P7JS21_9AGAM|nr:uncharacterized protein F5147DRAFT_775701 [Suillus discolor]KAG2103990.1 hypothetical protein F5147DRAFT_775701 [Suillus discolor]